MARVTVKLDVGDGRLRSLKALVNRLDRQLDNLYNKGANNHDTISNKELTNLQDQFRAFNQATANKKDSLSSDLQGAQAEGNVTLVNHIVKQIEQLVEAQATSNQLFNSAKYDTVSSYSLTSSKAFKSDSYDYYNREFKSSIQALSREIGQYANRSRIYENRWKTSYDTGVMSHERYQSYVDRGDQLKKDRGNLQDNYDDLYKEYQDRVATIQRQRDQVQNTINSGNYTQEDTKQRAALDEELQALKAYSDKWVELNITLDKASERNGRTTNRVNQAPKHIKIQAPENSLRGLIRKHASRIIREAITGTIAGAGVAIRTGDNIRLNTFDNIKPLAYAQKGNDNRVMNTLANAGYPMGYDVESMSKFANAYTSSTGNTNLSDKQLTKLTQAWGGLSRYSGAKESTTQSLEYIVGLTANYNNSSDSERLANVIQNEITKSGMSAKADEQQQALGTMYQIASQSAGGLSYQGQRDIAGFQGQMAKLGSDFQGQQGAQAYQGLVSSFNPMSKQARMIWGGENPEYRSQRGQAILMERMQKAPEHPYYYKEPISNLLAHASAFTKNKKKQRQIAASDLVQLSGNQLSFKQADQMVGAYQDGKFTKKNIRRIVKGNGKGKKDKYDMTTTKGQQQYFASYKKMAVKTSHALDKLRGKLAMVNHFSWLAPIAGGFISGAAGSIAMTAGKSVLKNPKGALKETRGFFRKSSVFNADIDSYTGKRIKPISKTSTGSASKLGSLFKGAKNKKVINATKKVARGKKGKLGLIAGGVVAGSMLFDNDKDNKAEASTVSKKHKGKEATTTDIAKLRLQVNAKHKLLHKQEWKLIHHLDTFWDVFLRKVKESAKNGGSDDGGDISGLSGKGDKAIREIAKAVAKKDNLDAKLVYAQLALESADGSSQEAMKDNNFSGIKGTGGGAATDDGGTYQHFDSISDFANRYAEVLRDYPLHKGMTPEEYASALKHGKNGAYYTADEGQYARNLKAWADRWATGGIRTHALGGNFAGNSIASANQSITSSMINDIRTVRQMSELRQSGNYIKTVRNAPQFKVKIDIQNANKPSKQSIIERAVSETFDLWIMNKQQQELNNYYSNEVTGLSI